MSTTTSHARAISPPSPWVRRWLDACGPGGSRTLLDVACGAGRHLRFALEQGWRVTGIDHDLAGVADLEAVPDVALIAADLEAGRPFPVNQSRFAAVVVTNYLWRPILADIVAAVAKDGLLIYETFAVGNERYGRPSNPDFLLRPGELVSAVTPALIPIAYEHGRLEDPPRIVQRIAAVGPAHPWLTMQSPLPGL